MDPVFLKTLYCLLSFPAFLLTSTGSIFLLTTWTAQTIKSRWLLWVCMCAGRWVWYDSCWSVFQHVFGGLKASGSLNTSLTCQDQLHTSIWRHCVLPSQTGKTKPDRDTMCFSTSQDVFYFLEWQQDYSISSLCHSLLCQYFDRGYFALFFLLAKVSTPQLRETTFSLFIVVLLTAVNKVEVRQDITKAHLLHLSVSIFL